MSLVSSAQGMKFRFPLLASVLLLGGCSDSARQTNAVTVQVTSKVAAPSFATGSYPGGGELGIFSMIGPGGQKLTVGDTPERAALLFPKTTDSYSFRQLPPGFEQPYGADGHDNGALGFGAIYYTGANQSPAIAMAMVQERDLTNDQINGTESFYEQQLGRTSAQIAGSVSRYWFWDDATHNQRLMLCAVVDKNDRTKYDLSSAVGDDVVMNALRMDEASAEQDKNGAAASAGSQKTP